MPSSTPLRLTLLLLAFLLAPACPAREPDAPAASALLDLDGKLRDVFRAPREPARKLAAFIFARTDCPISNVYAPEIRALHTAFAPRGVEFWLVYGGDETAEQIRKHLADFQYPCGALRDPGHAFAKHSRVRVTPEAAVYSKSGELRFHGRIDDRYVELGVRRPAPTVRDLHAALEDLLAGRSAKAPAGPAVGCIIEGDE